MTPEQARRLAARRVALGLSQRTLALAAGVSQSRLAEWEALTCSPTSRNLARWIGALDRLEAAGVPAADPVDPSRRGTVLCPCGSRPILTLLAGRCQACWIPPITYRLRTERTNLMEAPLAAV